MSAYHFRKAGRLYDQEQAAKCTSARCRPHRRSLTNADLRHLFAVWWAARHRPSHRDRARTILRAYVKHLRLRAQPSTTGSL